MDLRAVKDSFGKNDENVLSRLYVNSPCKNQVNQCFLNEKALQSVLKKKDLKKHAVSVITVIGSNKTFRQTLSKWLVRYYTKFNAQEGIFQVFGMEQITSSKKNQISIWPTAIISSHDELPEVVFILYLPEENTEILENFAAVASSSIFVSSQQDKNLLQTRMMDTCIKGNKKPGLISVYSTPCLLENIKVEDNAAAEIFYKFLDENPNEPLQTLKSENILIKDLMSHLKIFNQEVNTAAKQRSAITLQTQIPKTGFGSGSQVQIQTQETAKQSSKNQNKCVPIHGSKPERMTKAGHDPHRKDDEIASIAGSNSWHQKKCTREECNNLQEELKVILLSWISIHLNPFNIAYMLNCCMHLHKRDSHNLYSELGDLIGIAFLHNSQLRNLFDNYLCYAGEVDENQLRCLEESACNHSNKLLVEKHHVHFECTRSILRQILVALKDFYININQKIVANEKQLAKKLNEILVQKYQSEMTQPKYWGFDKTRTCIVHNNIKQYSILIAEKCMNVDGRLNNVVGLNKKNLSISIEQSLEALTKQQNSFIKKSMTDGMKTDSYIEEYMQHFYTDAISPLHKQTPEALIKLHKNIVHQLTTDIDWESRECLLERLYTHLQFVTEVVQQHQRLEYVHQSGKTFCLYLTSEWYYISLETINGFQILQDKKTLEKKIPAIAAITYEDKVVFGFAAREAVNKRTAKSYGQILAYLLENDCRNGNVFILFLESILENLSMEFNKKYSSCIVVIPSWLNVEARIRLRNKAQRAGIQHIFIINETSLISSSLLCSKRDTTTSEIQFVYIIQTSDKGVRVEVFEKTSGGRIHMPAISFVEWQTEPALMNKVVNAYNSFMGNSIRSGSFNNLSAQNVKTTFQNAMDRTFSQMHHLKIYAKPKFYVIINEQLQYNYVFTEYFGHNSYWCRVFNPQFDYCLPQVQNFLESPLTLASSVLIHAADVKFFEYVKQTYFKNYLMGKKSSCNLATAVDPVLLDKKKLLLENCKKMREQLANEKVKVRRLMQKIITESLDRAEKTAKNDYATLDDVSTEEKEIIELFHEHKFKI